jgi:hypothetical protein
MFLCELYRTNTVPKITENELLDIYINKKDILYFAEHKTIHYRFLDYSFKITLSHVLNYIVKDKNVNIVNAIYDLRTNKFKFNENNNNYLYDILNKYEYNLKDNISSIIPTINNNKQLLMVLTNNDKFLSDKYTDVFFKNKNIFEVYIKSECLNISGLKLKDENEFLKNIADELLLLLPLGTDFNIYDSIKQIINYKQYETIPKIINL